MWFFHFVFLLFFISIICFKFFTFGFRVSSLFIICNFKFFSLCLSLFILFFRFWFFSQFFVFNFRFSFSVYRFLFFVFQYPYFCFSFFAFRFSLLFAFCARRALLAGPRIIFLFFFNTTQFWILSISSCSEHLAHQIDLKKCDPDGFFGEKKNLLL